MSTPYQCALCHAQGWVCEYPAMRAAWLSSVNQDPEVIRRNFADTKFAAADVHAQPMAASYESGPLPAPDSMYGMYGSENCAVAVTHIPSANEYHGPDAELLNVKQTPETPTAKQSGQAPCPPVSCRWYDKDTLEICNAAISCGDVPTHFKLIHGIKNMNEALPIDCRWEGCDAQGARKNFARHIRECHLHHVRDKGHLP